MRHLLRAAVLVLALAVTFAMAAAIWARGELRGSLSRLDGDAQIGRAHV